MIQDQPYLTGDEIFRRIRVLASQSSSYFDRANISPTFLTILRGAERFSRQLRYECSGSPDTLNCRISTRAADGSALSEPLIRVPYSLTPSQTVVIVEDIVDTGRTLTLLVDRLRGMGVEKIHLISLLCREGLSVQLFSDLGIITTSFGFLVPKGLYMYGYGLDYETHQSRALHDIYVAEGVE